MFLQWFSTIIIDSPQASTFWVFTISSAIRLNKNDFHFIRSFDGLTPSIY